MAQSVIVQPVTDLRPAPDARTSSGRRVLAVGRIYRPCSNCNDFPVVKVRDGRGLRTVTCPQCTAPTIPAQFSGR
ncbi:hypothetical protein [Actinacidiphila glaucinigra]|uniref:hypothetical protein n=1 Tax=Actinacidiphila glaucinigra TaxID=235986 RepID=UPI00371E0459